MSEQKRTPAEGVRDEGYLQCRVCHMVGPVNFTPGVGYEKHCGETPYGPYPPRRKKCIDQYHAHDRRPWWTTYADHCMFQGGPPGERHAHLYDDDCSLCGQQHDAYLEEGAGGPND